MFTTPGGKPASTISSESFRAVRGVISEGFKTIVFPVARAGPIFQPTIACVGKNSVKYCLKRLVVETNHREVPRDNLALPQERVQYPQASLLDNAAAENAHHNAVRFVPRVSKFGFSCLERFECII